MSFFSDIKPTNTFIAIVGLLVFTQVSIVSSIFLFSAFSLLLLFAVLYYVKEPTVDKHLFYFLLFFILPTIISFLSLPISQILESAVFNYNELNIFGRLINISLLFFITLFIYSYTIKKDIGLFFRWYEVGLVILMLTALWHALSIYTSFISFPFETRDHLHSVYDVDYSFTGRVTGLASEPSYFVVFAVDLIALALVFHSSLKRNILIVLSVVLIFLSLSPSGFITLAGAFLGAYFFTSLRFKSKAGIRAGATFITLLVAVFVYLFFSNSLSFFEYVISRVANISLDESARLYMVLMPFSWASDSNVFTLLFGHGVKTYSIIGTHYNLPSGVPIHVTSNNMFVDIFWEAGLFGLFLLLSFFSYVFVSIYRVKFGKTQVFILFFIFFDLFLSSFFRADFASLRYFTMLLFLYVLLKNDYLLLRKKQ